MTNADKFKGIFGIYATELWAKPEKEFLEWLNEDVPDTNVGDTISRQAAIDAVLYAKDDLDAERLIKGLPSAQPNVHDRNVGDIKSCDICDYIEDGDTLYKSSDWDGGIGFDYIRDIRYCPKCGRRL